MSIISRLFRAPAEFVDHKVGEVKEEVRAELADGLASVTIYLMFGTLAMFALLFLSLALAIGIAIWTGIYYLGFILIGLIYGSGAWWAWRLSKDEKYMDSLRLRFRKILKKEKAQGNHENGIRESL